MKFPYQIIDLTHTIDACIPTWNGDCGFKHTITLDYTDCTAEVKFRVQEFAMKAGIGTHMDAPAHCFSGATAIEQLILSQLLSPCVVIDITDIAHEHYSLQPSDLEHFEKQHGGIGEGDFVMVRTGWERFWSEPDKYRNNYQFPSISGAAAEILLSRGISGLGIDTLSPDRPEDNFIVHQILLGKGKYLIENAANLAALPARGSFLLALPIKVKGATEAPIRLVGFVS